MKVLHVYRTYLPDPPGGIQETIRQICLATRDVAEPTVFTLSPTPEPSLIQRPEARVARCRSWIAPASCDLGGCGAFWTFRKLARAADVVHFHFPWPFADVLHFATRHGTPSVMTYHSDIVRQRALGMAYRPLMTRMLGSMPAIVATSPAYARTSRVLADPRVRGKVRTIPFGIDEKSYPDDADDSILARLGLRDGEAFFFFIGVMRYYKGIHFLLDAARDVDARIVIAGFGTECLRALATERGLSKVIFAGRIGEAEKVALLKRCRALVLPSHLRAEAFGMVLVEAAMFARPMISCEIGTGTSFVNAAGETGFVVPPAAPAALAAAMNRLLDDEALAARMGRAARLRYERLFSSAALGRAYGALYREVTGKK
ncbi:MAG: glycosyltransferase [Candidatus Accumulibacter sp.]|jgi:rhamnosyl/mannosyltransferase|nr:glycosyltransferase [Accumulibacter sp.]